MNFGIIDCQIEGCAILDSDSGGSAAKLAEDLNERFVSLETPSFSDGGPRRDGRR